MMKKIHKLLALVLVLVLTLALFTACGKSDSKKESKKTDSAKSTEASGSESVNGKTAEYKGYSVLIPEGFELKEPGEFSSYDFSVRKSDFSYFDFNTEQDDDLAMQHYNYNKSTYTNEQKDVSATCGGNTWTGFQYSDGWGGYGFEAYTTLGDHVVRVSSAGFQFDSAEAQAVLASLTKN